MVVLLGQDDLTVCSDPRYYLVGSFLYDRGIPHYMTGAIQNLDGQPQPRDLREITGAPYIITLDSAADAACTQQGIAHDAFPDLQAILYPQTHDLDTWQLFKEKLDALSLRLPLDGRRYLAIRDHLVNRGYEPEWKWAQTVTAPENAEDLANNAIMVVCNSGFRAQAAAVMESKVQELLAAGRSATLAYPSSGKGRAIDTLWANRQQYFETYRKLVARDAIAEDILDWIAKSGMPYVSGKILRYHFAKNLGVACAKPDRHLARLAGVPETDAPESNYAAVMTMCRALEKDTGDKIGVIDVILWRACNLGLLQSRLMRGRHHTS